MDLARTKLYIDEKHIFIILEIMIWCSLIGSINQNCFRYISRALNWEWKNIAIIAIEVR